MTSQNTNMTMRSSAVTRPNMTPAKATSSAAKRPECWLVWRKYWAQ